jgi:hypothetical protein
MKVFKKIFNKDSNFILVSYFWGRNNVNKGSIYKLTYGEQVKRIIEDCTKLEVNYYFVEFPELTKKSYQEALSYKPSFIKGCLDKFKNKSCIFVDTDLRVLKYPYIFESESDLFFINWNFFDHQCHNPYQIVLPGAVLGFGNSRIARQILDLLIANLKSHQSEDKSFSGLLTRYFLTTYARCIWLPSTYLYMFDKHTYEPGKGYTNVVNYSKELKNSGYKLSDLVLVHEDFETGALDDIYNEKISKVRYPPQVDRQLGQKLRCLKRINYYYYKNWGMSSKQYSQHKIDIVDNTKFKIKTVPKYIKPEFDILEEKLIYKSTFLILTTTKSNLDNYNVNYIIVDKISPSVIYSIMKKSKDYNILILQNFKLKQYPKVLDNNLELDFICYNSNNSTVSCNDPRILNTRNENLLYLSNNHLIRQFLLIWNELGDLQFSFNKTLAINKLRCFWFKDNQISKFVKIDKTTYKKKKITNKFRKRLEQCGIKPKLNDEDVTKSHYSGSISKKKEFSKYNKFFLLT